MSDLISREAALLTLKIFDYDIIPSVLARQYVREMLDTLYVKLNELPSAEPERKKGKWLPHPGDEDLDVCSVCGTGCKRRERGISQYIPWVTEYNYQFCPYCGADMRGE